MLISSLIITISILLHCGLNTYSASMRGDNATAEKITEEIQAEPDRVPIQKLSPAKEHFPHINKHMLANEYKRYAEEVELDPKNREALPENTQQGSAGHRSKMDEVRRQLVESQRVDRRIDLLGRMGNAKDFRLDELEHLGESLQGLGKKVVKGDTDDEFRDQLKEFDVERRRKFLRMEKRQKLSEKDKLRLMAETERLKEEKRLEDEHQKKEYAKLNHPGSRDHLESVWTDSDGFDKGTFTPAAFFRLHDKNGDNYLDILEIEAFFIPEIRKVYGSESLNYEAREELALMREHLMPEMDLNHDKLVSLDEFLSYTSNNERFDKNEGWQTLDQFDQYSQDELREFADERRKRGDSSYDYDDYLEPFEDSDYEDYSNQK